MLLMTLKIQWKKRKESPTVKFFCVSLQRLLGAVQKNATRGDPRSVIQAIDDYCKNKEWAMNVGDEKGPALSFWL